MPSTPEESQLAKDALGLILAKYRNWIDPAKLALFHRPRDGDLFHFVDTATFNRSMITNRRQGCVVVGYFRAGSDGTPDEIFINKELARPATIVHELLHYFSSEAFSSSVTFDLDEATTEYLTRKLVTVATTGFDAAVKRWYDLLETKGSIEELRNDPQFRIAHRRAAFMGDRTGSYDRQVGQLSHATGLGKLDPRWKAIGQPPIPPPPGGRNRPDVIKRAFFRGEPDALGLLKECWRIVEG